jgi:hypothetical protein
VSCFLERTCRSCLRACAQVCRMTCGVTSSGSSPVRVTASRNGRSIRARWPTALSECGDGNIQPSRSERISRSLSRSRRVRELSVARAPPLSRPGSQPREVEMIPAGAHDFAMPHRRIQAESDEEPAIGVSSDDHCSHQRITLLVGGGDDPARALPELPRRRSPILGQCHGRWQASSSGHRPGTRWRYPHPVR